MRYHIKEYGKYMEITGYSNVKFSDAETFLRANRKENTKNCEVQFFDANLIATQQHLYFATFNALQAFHNKTSISKSLAMETMLYASAQRQIQKAIQRCGIKPETTRMAVVIVAEKPSETATMLKAVSGCTDGQLDEKVLEMTKSKEARIQKAFEITDQEVETVINGENRCDAVVKLVIERVALLATQL